MASVSCVHRTYCSTSEFMKSPPLPPVLPLSLKYFVVYSEIIRAERKLASL